jgi:hypothetical protein
MAKVEGSNPFIRFERKPCKSQGFLLLGAGSHGLWQGVGSSRG